MNKDNVLNNYLEIVPEVQERFKKQCKKSLIDDTDESLEAFFNFFLV